MSGLPKGWVATTMGDCFLEVRNGTTATQNTEKKGFPVSRIETIQNRQFDLNRIRHIENITSDSIESFRYQFGDIAFSHINSYEHVGKTALYKGQPEILVHGMNLLRIRLGHNEIDPDFAFLFMQTQYFREEVRQRVGHAVNQVSINQKNLAEVPFVIAPLNEQHRIVAKLEELLAKVDASQKRLAKIPVILKRFRQAVLAAACSGRLTADWRDEKKAGEWNWATLSNQDISIQTGPFGSALHKHDYVSNGVPLINPMHIREGQIHPNANQSVSENKLKELTRYLLFPGDIVLGRRGEMGRAAVVQVPGLLCGTGSLILRATSKNIVPEFLCLLLRSPLTCAFLEEGSVGSTMTNLNQQIVGALEFPIVGSDEQQEIVRRVESYFTLANQLEARYLKAQYHVDKLTQSILAKAFRGELVPQDPNDEPASALLERIRTQGDDSIPPKMKKELSDTTVPKKRRTRNIAPPPLPVVATFDVKSLNVHARKIYRHMKRNREYSKDEIAVPLILSTSEWNSAIRELKESGAVVQNGDKRGARYTRN
ncbi:MAG: restriction endonuclease subunit S [Desulfuromonadaceae bacterium]|nr:restriction endonuclease subunit S [Desulfuromonadaceae bacterium]